MSHTLILIIGKTMEWPEMSKIRYSPYQLAHLTKLYSNGFNSLLICDGVGVGKTISAGYAIYHQSMVLKRPVMIICPSILVDKWYFEMKTKFNLNVTLTTQKESLSLMKDEIEYNPTWENQGPVYLTTFNILSRLDDEISPDFGLVVIDEIHNIRNPKTKTFPKTRAMCKNADYTIGLSATPINNLISDLASIFAVLMPKYSFEELDQLFTDIWGLSALDCISCVITRFNKEEISSDFTKRNIHNISIKYPKDYDIMVDENISLRYPGVTKGSLETIALLRMASSSPFAFYSSIGRKMKKEFDDPKLDSLIKIIKEKPNERWLIFTEFRKTAEYIVKHIHDRLVLQMSGSSNREEREAHVYLFQKTVDSVMIMTPVGSEGLDFQICSNLINYDLHWNPMRIEQRIGRIDRIGQEKKEINIYNINILGSIDEQVMKKIGDKLSIIFGSFIDIPSIIDDGKDKINSGNDLLYSELKNAKDLIKSTIFYNQIGSLDSVFIKGLNTENCNIYKWKELEWGKYTPWIHEVEKWHKDLELESSKFDKLIKSYSQN
jgi:SNF2 family DNA or RNA helicase